MSVNQAVSITVPPSPDVARTRRWALASTGTLIVLGLLWELWLAPLPGGSGGKLAVKVLPLVLALPGLARLRMPTYRWLSLCIWLYMAEGLVRAYSDTGLSATLAGLEVVLSLAVFLACAAHVRARLRAAPAGADTPRP